MQSPTVNDYGVISKTKAAVREVSRAALSRQNSNCYSISIPCENYKLNFKKNLNPRQQKALILSNEFAHFYSILCGIWDKLKRPSISTLEENIWNL